VLVARAVGYSQKNALRIRRQVHEFLSNAVSNYGPIPRSCWR
jgi:hypothetical protein